MRWADCRGGFFRKLVRPPAATDETPEKADVANCKRMIAMADDLLIAMIIAGFGLSGAYFRAGFVSWRRNQAAERKREISLRELHSNSLCGVENGVTPRKAPLRTLRRGDRCVH